MSLVNCINLIKHLHLSSYDTFRNALLKFIKPIERKIFKIHDHGIKILNKTEISHLHEHKFRHAFKGFLNPLCSCSIEAETTTPTSDSNIVCQRVMLTRSFVFVNLLKVSFYPFKELVLYFILLWDFFFDYNFDFYISSIQIKYISSRAKPGKNIQNF